MATQRADVLVVGGGTSGAALAGLLARDGANVVLLEGGPDYGHRHSGNWPADLLDASRIPDSHNWGYDGINHPRQKERHPYPRARVIGGCSAHNGCVALLGHRRDYDHWAETGCEGWSWDDVAPAFERAKSALRVRIPDDDEVTPFQAGFVGAATRAGVPRVHDLNDPDDTAGVAPSPANIVDGVRWNTSFAYLDPERESGRLTVVGNVLVDRVLLDGNRAVGVEAIVDGERQRLFADRVVLSAGAYGSPAILIRSGVGPPEELAKHGIDLAHDLPAVGNYLADHPVVHVYLKVTDALRQQLDEFSQSHWTPDEQTLLKTRSSKCREAFDLHLYAVGGLDLESGEHRYMIEVSCIMPRSSGQMTLSGPEPDAPPVIDHGYLTDPEGHDLAVLLDGIELACEIVGEMQAGGLIQGVEMPAPDRSDRDGLSRWVEENVGIYYHPACTCRMGPAGDRNAVVDPRGRVQGVDSLYVCDASIFPVIMRANTNLPAAMLAEHMAGWIGGR